MKRFKNILCVVEPGFIIGNTAETILNQIDCSVLAIKPSGFATAVTLEE
jgi:hypothetical protein